VLGKKKPLKGRPGEHAPKVNLDHVRAELKGKIQRDPTDDDVWSYLMYPDVLLKFDAFRKAYSDVSVLPTPAYYYGLQEKEEISVGLEEGKTIFVRLLNLTDPDPNAQRTAIFELNGYPATRRWWIAASRRKPNSGPKPIPRIPTRSAPPCPAWVASVAVSVGNKVKEEIPSLCSKR